MKPFLYLFLIGALLAACDAMPRFGAKPRMAFHFNEPASAPEAFIPLGNGRIGLAMDGGIDQETLVMNEISMWSGSPQDAENPEALRALFGVRELIAEGRPDEAQKLMNEAFVCRGAGANGGRAAEKPFGSYQLLGRLRLGYDYGQDGRDEADNYRRELNLEDAVSTVHFRRGKAKFTREAFTSFTADVAVIRLTADGGRGMKLRIGMDRPERYRVSTDGKELEMHGRLYVGDEKEAPPVVYTLGDSAFIYAEDSATRAAREEGGGVRYAARVRVLLPKGGALRAENDTTLAVVDAPEVILLVGMATDYFGGEPQAGVRKQLDAAAAKTYDELRSEHVAAYRARYERVTIRLGGGESGRDEWPIDRRIEAFARDGRDASLAALYYQFGRYLLLSSTRPGSLPPGPQGLWCHTVQAPDNGAYRPDGALEMCLRAAETGHLPELIGPAVDYTKRLAAEGRKTAASFYGVRGWTVHARSNIWGFTAPDRMPSPGAASTSAARLCGLLYDHFRFTCDTGYLRSLYPTMREAALFLADRLTEDAQSRHLVLIPAFSPENTYVTPEGRRSTVSAGSAVDDALVRELFANTVRAATILKMDAELSGLLTSYLMRIAPTQFTPEGLVAEWPMPLREADPRTPYVPQLYGLYPATEISPVRHPEAAAAARRTLESRGDAVGLPSADRVCLWARLGDSERAYESLRSVLRPVSADEEGKAAAKSVRSGTRKNLLFGNPTLCLPGNLGAAAGIAEMLVRSDDDVIEFLPALPRMWSDGEFSGLCVRGGGEVWARWRGNERCVGLRATRAGVFRILLPARAADLRVKVGGRPASVPVVSGAVRFSLSAGEEVEIDWRVS